MDATAVLSGQRIVPVVVIEEEETAVPLAETLLEAGLGAIEVTLRTDCAMAALKRIATAVPGMIAGAGSVRNGEQLQQAAGAGARFAVSPGATERLLDAAEAVDCPLVPGAVSASEVMRLLERGYALQKFFPAEAAGGIATLKALGGPLPQARFFPTGGITPELAAGYLALASVPCVGGSWLAPARLLADRDFTAIGRLARDAVQRFS